LIKKKTKRLRIFAGPNGSGKSTLSDALRNNKDSRINLGIFVNADEIENELKVNKKLNLEQYKIFTDTKELRDFINSSGNSQQTLSNTELAPLLKVRNNTLYIDHPMNSYIAADIAAFIREKLLLTGVSFSFESVFSHPSKLKIIKDARALGFRIYFYFITTDDVDININRVKIRVAKKGHPVAEEKIRERYFRSLAQMYPAIKLSHRSYLFDNSGKHYELIATVEDGKKVEVTDFDKVLPNWFFTYIYRK